MSTESIPTEPDTFVLIHGLWTTPRVWEHWIERFEHRDYHVVAPTYPGFEGDVEALREDPSPIEAVTLPDTVEHLERVISELPSPPTLIGHGFGGTLVQILLDRGFGAAGIAIASVPTEGVHAISRSVLRATFPVLHNPANRHRAVGFTPKQFHRAFTTTLGEPGPAVYERYHIPRRMGLDSVLASISPVPETWSTTTKPTAPLLLSPAAGGGIVPALARRTPAFSTRRAPTTWSSAPRPLQSAPGQEDRQHHLVVGDRPPGDRTPSSGGGQRAGHRPCPGAASSIEHPATTLRGSRTRARPVLNDAASRSAAYIGMRSPSRASPAPARAPGSGRIYAVEPPKTRRTSHAPSPW
jgi:hypothetical protein